MWSRQAQASSPTSRRRLPFPFLTRIDPRRGSRSDSISDSASWILRPPRHSTTISARSAPSSQFRRCCSRGLRQHDRSPCAWPHVLKGRCALPDRTAAAPRQGRRDARVLLVVRCDHVVGRWPGYRNAWRSSTLGFAGDRSAPIAPRHARRREALTCATLARRRLSGHPAPFRSVSLVGTRRAEVPSATPSPSLALFPEVLRSSRHSVSKALKGAAAAARVAPT